MKTVLTMTYLRPWLLTCMTAFALSFTGAACGEDDDEEGNHHHTPTASPEATPTPTPDATPTPAQADQCTNAADLAIITGGTVDVTGEAQTCGLSCVSDANPVTCSQECVVTATGVSAGCATCYAGIIKCAIDNCLNQCIADPSGEPCVTCRNENCLPAFEYCSGIDSSSNEQ